MQPEVEGGNHGSDMASPVQQTSEAVVHSQAVQSLVAFGVMERDVFFSMHSYSAFATLPFYRSHLEAKSHWCTETPLTTAPILSTEHKAGGKAGEGIQNSKQRLSSHTSTPSLEASLPKVPHHYPLPFFSAR